MKKKFETARRIAGEASQPPILLPKEDPEEAAGHSLRPQSRRIAEISRSAPQQQSTAALLDSSKSRQPSSMPESTKAARNPRGRPKSKEDG
jgi:hypothetical protein